MNSKPTRRRFLGQANCAAIGSVPILNTLLNLKLAGDAAAVTAPSGSEYRALVCIFLSGGIDSFNLLVPRGNAEYAEYQTVRGSDKLALPQASLLPISPDGLSGLQLGLHPALTGIQSLFQAGKAACVTNVGTLIEPLTKDDYNNDSKRLPLGLFSHSDQIEQWQTGMPHVRSSKGWAGRMADLLQSLNAGDSTSMNISLSGSNIWQSGDTAFEYTVSTDGAETLTGYDPDETNIHSVVPARTRAVDSQLALDYQHVLTQAFAQKKTKAIDAFKKFNAATNVTLPSSVTWPSDNYLADQLKMIARSILGHTALGHVRQTFFIDYGGWDHHDDLIKNQAEMLPEVDAAIKAFYDTLAARSLEDNVTLFTSSDFGRTLSSDRAGSDHAWGGNQFVIGGAVNGRKVYGQYPSLYEDAPLDLGRGRLIPEIAVDSYFAELALWLGVPKASLSTILPNIATFYDTTRSEPPLGFMA